MSDILRGFRSAYYNKETIIFLLGLAFVLPLQFCLMILSQVFSFLPEWHLDLVFGAFYLMLALLQVPYVILCEADEEVRFGEVLRRMYEVFPAVYVPSLFFGLLVVLGSYFGFVPGMIFMVLGFYLPYIAVSQPDSIKGILKNAFLLVADRFFEALTIVCSFGFLYFSLEWVMLNLLALMIQVSPLLIVIVQSLILAMLLPLLAYLTNEFHKKWKDLV